MEPSPDNGRRGAMPTTHRLLSVFAVAALVAACAVAQAPVTDPPQGSGPPSTQPSPQPSVSPVGAIEHATGATDVLLRAEDGGGHMMAMFTATQVPYFTLYGDGTVIFQKPSLEVPPAEGSLIRQHPLRTTRLSEPQIQELLQFAGVDSGLAIARPNYPNDQVADASTTTFTLTAGGIDKRVDVYALGMELQGGVDAIARASFSRLAERLRDFDEGGAFTTDVYVPERYRGVLLDNGGIAPPDVKPWPWKTLKPADFVNAIAPDRFPLPSHTMTVAELEELGLEGIEGGIQGPSFHGPDDGKTYSFALRPLLPDEVR